MDKDVDYMRSALALARQGLGRVWPNPAVGCVIIKSGSVVARARTGDSGRPHAEKLALDMASGNLKGATVYVTLEPCNHQREGGACADHLVASGVTRIVVATADTDQRTAGQGIEKMQRAGLCVDTGVLEEEAVALNRGFFLRCKEGRPLFSLKIASTIDGKIATATGQSQWITGDLARCRGHLERASHDAVLTGIGTVLTDDPELSCRLTGLQGSSVRIVIDTDLRIPERSRLLSTLSAGPVWIVTAVSENDNKYQRLVDKGVDMLRVGRDEAGHCELGEVAAMLASRGLTRVLVEAGATLTAAFLRSSLCDRLLWFRSSSMIGGDGLAAPGDLGVAGLSQQIFVKRKEILRLGDDCLEIYERPA